MSLFFVFGHREKGNQKIKMRGGEGEKGRENKENNEFGVVEVVLQRLGNRNLKGKCWFVVVVAVEEEKEREEKGKKI